MLTAVGLYSNYYMLIEICRTFINQIFDNINHSVGNLVANESMDKIYSIFKVYYASELLDVLIFYYILIYYNGTFYYFMDWFRIFNE